MLRLVCVTALICGAATIVLAAPAPAQAHQDGCHAQHSCPSDTGSYICGDTGNYSECPGMAPYTIPSVTTANFATPDVGSTLSCSGGNWSASVVSRSYQWLRNGVDEPGQTDPTYVLTAADVSVAVACRVTATDGRAQSAVATSNPVVVAPPPALTAISPPTIDASSLPVHVGSFLVCKPSIWSVATTAIRYQWLRDGVAIPGAASDSYRVSAEDVGTTLACQEVAKGSRGQDGVAVTTGVVAKAVSKLSLRQQSARGVALPCGASAARACRPAGGTVVRFGGTGTASIPLAGKVEVEFQRKVRRGWVTRRTSRVAMKSDGTFVALYKVPPLAYGAWRVRAALNPTATTTSAVAPYRYLLVRGGPIVASNSVPARRGPSTSRPSQPGASDIYNCDDFPLPDGTTAQQYLELYPSDPSGLDGNNDGVACEG